MKGWCVKLQLSAAPVTAMLNARPPSSRKSIMAVKLCALLLQNATSTGSLSFARPIKLPSGNDRLMGRRVVSGGRRTDSSRLSQPPLITKNLARLVTLRGTCGGSSARA